MIECGWQKNDTLALALSGGIDSMVLYHLLTTTYKASYKKLILLHVNHGVRKASQKEEQALCKMAEKEGFEIVVCHLNMAENFNQNDARGTRFQFFDRTMKSFKADVLLTAHHLNDHDETIMHQLLTGRYTHQYVGIEQETVRGDYRVLRPLSGLARSDIEAYQKHHDILYFEDVSNSETHYTRNYIRHKIMPGIYQSADLHEDALRVLADDLNGYQTHMKHYAETFLKQSGGALKKSRLLEEDSLAQFYIVKAWFLAADIRVTRKAVESMLEVLDGASQVDFNVSGVKVGIRYDDIVMLENDTEVERFKAVFEPGIYHFNGYTIEINDASLLPLNIRTRQSGDRMHVDNTGTKKISRILIDYKVTREVRETIPVIEDVNGVIIALGTIYNIMNTKDNLQRLIIKKEFSNDAKE